MCGRILLAEDSATLKNELGLETFIPPFRPTWNTPPATPVLVMTLDREGRRVVEHMRWGLIPAWSKDGQAGSTFNARAETLREKPTFRDAWRKRQRCLIVTSGFYEWRKRDKRPFAVTMAHESLMLMAGLWDEWTSPDGELIKTCTVITTTPNDVMAPIHDRMPVILAKTDWPAWLGETPATEVELYGLLKSCPDIWLKIWPIHTRVGNVRANDPDLMKEFEPIGELPL